MAGAFGIPNNTYGRERVHDHLRRVFHDRVHRERCVFQDNAFERKPDEQKQKNIVSASLLRAIQKRDKKNNNKTGQEIG